MTSKAASSGRCVSINDGLSRCVVTGVDEKGGSERRRKRAIAVTSFVQLASLKTDVLSMG